MLEVSFIMNLEQKGENMIYIIFLFSLIAVTKGADWLVEGAVGLTNIWGISQIVVGATIVSLGTTLPETLISAFAATQGKGDVIAGTALGSILFNTAVILGLATLIKPPRVQGRDTFFKAGTMVGVLVLFTLLGFDAHISRFDALLLVLVLALFLYSNIKTGVNGAKEEKGSVSKNELYGHIFRFLIGCSFVVGGAHFLLESGVEIARILHVPEAIIAVTLFAVGSSLPELITSVTAARKGHTDLVLGNVIGANTLNIIFVISTAGLIRPFAVAASILTTEVLISLLVMSILLLPSLFIKRISRIQGFITISIYLGYLYMVL